MTGICTPKEEIFKIQSKNQKGNKRKLTVHADGEILAER
jgi:hypothetical protein